MESLLESDAGSLREQGAEALVLEYLPLIQRIAQRISSRLPDNVDLNDLINSGVIGLIDAISKFDPSRKIKFKTYAEIRVRGAILDELRAQDWASRSLRSDSNLLENTYNYLEQNTLKMVKSFATPMSLSVCWMATIPSPCSRTRRCIISWLTPLISCRNANAWFCPFTILKT